MEAWMGVHGSVEVVEQSKARGAAVRENLARTRGVLAGIRQSLDTSEHPTNGGAEGLPPLSPRRQYPRYPIQIPFVCTAKTPQRTRTTIGWTRNLGEGGACIELSEVLPPDTPVWIRMRSDQGTVEMGGKVVWSENGKARGESSIHGLSFTESSPAQQQALEGLIRSRGVIRPSRVRLPFEVPVTCRAVNGPAVPLPGWTRDVSRGGLMLRLPRELSPGTELRVTLHTDPQPISVDGVIAWVAPPEGRTPGGPVRHGFRFTRPHWSAAAALGRLLADPR
jgi:c-di-GMP-binding flagellar brake protein YcgR